MEKEFQSPKQKQEKIISRKEAIQKAGKYAAFTAASMILLMSPATSAPAQQSPQKPKHH